MQLLIPALYNAFLRMTQRLLRRQVTFLYDHTVAANHHADKMDVSAVTAKAGALEIRSVHALDFNFVSPAEPQQAAFVSVDQHERWRKSSLCVRCGSATHWVAECPQRPTVSRSGPKVR